MTSMTNDKTTATKVDQKEKYSYMRVSCIALDKVIKGIALDLFCALLTNRVFQSVRNGPRFPA